MNRLLAFIREEDGPTVVEYAFMLGCIITVCLVAVKALGTSVVPLFSSTADALP